MKTSGIRDLRERAARFYKLTDKIRAIMKKRGITEEAVITDFEKARKARRRGGP